MAHGVSLQRIRLELARTPEYPEGSARHGYEFVAPLKDDGHIDSEAMHKVRELCRVTRFWGDAEEEHGRFAHTRHGWCFTYGDDADEESFFKLERHLFKPGAYVSITEHDGVQRPFRVVLVTPAITRE
jgi:hypothetical protein